MRLHPKGMMTRHDMPARERAQPLILTNNMRGIFKKDPVDIPIPKSHAAVHICASCGNESKTTVQNGQCIGKCRYKPW